MFENVTELRSGGSETRERERERGRRKMKERSKEDYQKEEVEDKETERIIGWKNRWEYIVIKKETKITNGIKVGWKYRKGKRVTHCMCFQMIRRGKIENNCESKRYDLFLLIKRIKKERRKRKKDGHVGQEKLFCS